MATLSVRGIAGLTKQGRHSDGNNLYLNVSPNGARSWIVMWKRSGRRREMGLGPYPAVGLAEARQRAAQAMRQVRDGLDPIAEKRRPAAKTFGAVADRYIEERVSALKNPAHRRQWVRSLTELAKSLRAMAIDAISVDDVAGVIRPVWKTRHETGFKLRIHIAKVFDFAKALKMRSGPNPAAWAGNLKDILPQHDGIVQHRAAMSFKDVPAFMARVREKVSMPRRVLEFEILTAARSTQVREMVWDEVNLKDAIWNAPADRMKQKRSLQIPLSPRAIEILEEARSLGDGKGTSFVFPGQKQGRPVSSKAVSDLFTELDIEKGSVTVHGYRSSFRDWAGDVNDAPREVAEAALGHVVGDGTEQAYRRHTALEKRRVLMNEWAEYCAGQASP